MRAVLCKNVPAVRDFRDVICRAAWKNSGSVCGHVAPFPVFPEIFFGFPAFRGRNFGRDFPARRRKMVAGFIFFFVFRLAQNWPFSGNSCPPVGKKWRFSENYSPSAVIKLAVFGKFMSSYWYKNGCFRKFSSSGWQKMVFLAKFFSFGWHKNGRFWEIFVLLLAKNGDSWKIFVLRMT